jgi:ribosomal protein S20
VEAIEKQKELRPKVLKEKLNAAASKDIISKNTASKSQG